jgi:uncharacterized protein DUF6896
MITQSLRAAMLSLIQQYINRQQLVSEVIHQLRPDLLMLSTQTEWTPQRLELLEQQQELVKSTPQKGQWGEWHYFFHGGGCRLVHVLTSEPINWDLPDLNCFDKFWFLEYLEWLLSQARLNNSAAILKSAFADYSGSFQAFTFLVLEQLKVLGHLADLDSQNKYRFLHPLRKP